jgi:hypothetical protein
MDTKALLIYILVMTMGLSLDYYNVASLNDQLWVIIGTMLSLGFIIIIYHVIEGIYIYIMDHIKKN